MPRAGASLLLVIALSSSTSRPFTCLEEYTYDCALPVCQPPSPRMDQSLGHAAAWTVSVALQLQDKRGWHEQPTACDSGGLLMPAAFGLHTKSTCTDKQCWRYLSRAGPRVIQGGV